MSFSQRDVGGEDTRTDTQASNQKGLFVLTGSCGFYSAVKPYILVVPLYLVMSLFLINGLLVLLSVRQLAFVRLSVRKLKEDTLTYVGEGTSSVCSLCVNMHVCHFVSIHLLL